MLALELTLLPRRRKHSSLDSTASSRSSSSGYPRNMSRSAADDSFAAYKEVVKGMSAKRGSASQTVSRDDVVVTGSRRASVVKTEPTSSSQGRKTKGCGVITRASHQSAVIGRSMGILATALTNLNLSVFPRDGTILPIGDTTEVIKVP
ncbi:hypothetical protein Bca52824_033417 [Brassica carinata]|uniref:Uncharacterized protein n=1 Tax=Brassica carinata TaxID=52824 RepID=A0A8X7SE64_BRACI|nr:hypothetical protein Bca52824_033417 [Brassica carinata]